MSVWRTMLKIDMWILKNQWLSSLGIAVIVTAAVLTASSLGFLNAGVAPIVGGILMCTSWVAFPAQLFRGINKEMKEASTLWLHTPTSGWAMLCSKFISRLIGTMIYSMVCYFLALALFHSMNISHFLPSLHYQSHVSRDGITWNVQHGTSQLNVSPENFSILVGQIPRIELYVMVFFLCCGLYLALWITLIYISVCAVRNRMKKFSWLVGLGIVLIATWGLGALKSTTLYQQLFGWGRLPILNLFPPDVRGLFMGHLSATITIGYFTFDAIIVVLLFYVTGLLIDRYLEV